MIIKLWVDLWEWLSQEACNPGAKTVGLVLISRLVDIFQISEERTWWAVGNWWWFRLSDLSCLFGWIKVHCWNWRIWLQDQLNHVEREHQFWFLSHRPWLCLGWVSSGKQLLMGVLASGGTNHWCPSTLGFDLVCNVLKSGRESIRVGWWPWPSSLVTCFGHVNGVSLQLSCVGCLLWLFWVVLLV